MRTLIVETEYGRHEKRVFRVTIPDNWRITYSGVNPQHGNDPAIRFYEGKNQMGCIRHVVSWRDMRVKIEEFKPHPVLDRVDSFQDVKDGPMFTDETKGSWGELEL